MRRVALLLVPAVLLAASPALANRGRRLQQPPLDAAGQLITRGGTSPQTNLARARARRVLDQAAASRQAPAAGRQDLSGRDRLRHEIERARASGGQELDRRSKIALFVGVPVITGWIYAVSQYGHAILDILAR